MVNGAKCWCGTLQLEDETFDGETWLKNLLDKGFISYGIGQIEQGSHCHMQFYLILEKRHILNWLKKTISDKAHFEQARGSPAQNKAYCSKEDTRVKGPWEVGECRWKGFRSDLDAVSSMVKDGYGLEEIAENFPNTWVRYHRGIASLKHTLDNRAREFGPEGPEVWIFWGEPGTGKSRRAFETWPDAYVKPNNGKWWDGYEGQETVIFDDFKGSAMSLHDFQRVIDWYPLRMEVKGGYVNVQAKRYVFTANHHPSEWYSEDADKHGTVMRRVNEFCADRGRLIHMVNI